ncbi:hypothetical protein DPEC_G00356540 [Dallia pectoralis]|uniref:Uncharacterized protein n=1 Tax=Dallia pectoralis TaxID=75939 RepID=A0ACC2EZR0_DALPE|nr:hypothetical protein DPEC_G00356540 [Dallia pectoralis]
MGYLSKPNRQKDTSQIWCCRAPPFPLWHLGVLRFRRVRSMSDLTSCRDTHCLRTAQPQPDKLWINTRTT